MGWPDSEMRVSAFKMPHTVPSKPMNGDTEPVVARMDRPICKRAVTLSIDRCKAMASHSLSGISLVRWPW